MTLATHNPFTAFVAAQAAKQTAPKAKVAVVKPPRESKRTKAESIYREYIKQGKSAVISLYKTELDMTDAGANSYFYATKKLVAAK